MSKPWLAEYPVEAPLARALIEAQFPELAPARLQLLGEGWDNTAFLVNDCCVFRFPRRKIAVQLLEAEQRLLPQIAPRLPLPVPIPEFHGHPEDQYPWPFAGYRLLPGRTASAAGLDEAQRLQAAEPMARFLAALHSLPAEEMERLGARPDVFGRLEVKRRAVRARQRLESLLQLGLVKDAENLLELLERTDEPQQPRPKTLVHGDLYASHLLVDAEGRPCGVIDWGDAHLGDPAVDLSIVFAFLPPAGRELFQHIYGDIDQDTLRLARFKALDTALAVLTYGHDIGKDDLVREGQTALRYIALF